MTNGNLTARQKDFTLMFYDEVNNVIGGDNPNQMLTLLLPGIALTKEDFEYDYKAHAEKGPTVEANEAKLANKLYDPYHISGADNGRMLPHQYKSALDALTPKLNPEITRAKNELRKLLLTKYPFKFDESSKDEINTFQEVFFHLYNDYVNELKEWNKTQTRVKAEIEEEYKDEVRAAVTLEQQKAVNTKINNKYLTWYETEAQGALTAVNQKMSALLSVFSENDMKVIEGILDSGTGAELQEARETMRNLRKLTPDGGYIYPVKFNPTNWFELLDTNFKPIDLLESPTLIYEKLHVLQRQKISLAAKMKSLSAMVPTEQEVQDKVKAMKQAEDAYDKAFDSMAQAGVKALGEFATKVTEMVCACCLLPADAGAEAAINSVVKPYVSDSNTGLINNMVKQGDAVSKAVSALDKAIGEYTDKLSIAASASNRAQLKSAKDSLQGELDLVNYEITQLTQKAALYQAMSYDEDVQAQSTPDGYSSFYILHKHDASKGYTKEDVSVSTKTTGSGFWIFKKKKKSTETESSFEQICEDKSTEIEIGMNIAKVGIEREWFNPGVFTLSDEMYHLTEKPISGQFVEPGYDPDKYIFPCFPVAMLIARDVTIKVYVSADKMKAKVHEAVSESSTSKSYVFYNAGNGSKTTSKESRNSDNKECMAIVIKIPTPQVIGFYLENTPKDMSTKYQANTDMDNIRKFVEAYMKVIAEKTNELKK